MKNWKYSRYTVYLGKNGKLEWKTSKENFLQSFCAGKWSDKVSMKDSNQLLSFHRIYD